MHLKTPSVVRRLRTRLDDARARKLRSELTAEQKRARDLEERLAALQRANEIYYEEQYDASDGPRFDPDQPFGTLPAKGGAA